MGDWKTNDVITAERLNAMQTAVFEIEAEATDSRLSLQLQASYNDLKYCMENNIPVQAICQDCPLPTGSGLSGTVVFTLYSLYKNMQDQTYPFNALFFSLIGGQGLRFTQSDSGADEPMNAVVQMS